MIARTQLAAFDNNHNFYRKQAVVKQGSSQGSLRYNLVFPKVRKALVVKPVMEEKQFKYQEVLKENIMGCKRQKKKRAQQKIKWKKQTNKRKQKKETMEKPDKHTAIHSQTYLWLSSCPGGGK